MRPTAWGRTSHRGCGYGPQHRPGQDPARKRVEQFRPVDRETGPLNGCGGVSAQVASGIRLDHSGVRRSCQRARLPQPCAGRLSRRAPALAEPRTGSWLRPGQAPGEPQDDHAYSREHRFERLEPDPCQLGGLEAHQPPPRRPSTTPGHTGGRATATTRPAVNHRRPARPAVPPAPASR